MSITIYFYSILFTVCETVTRLDVQGHRIPHRKLGLSLTIPAGPSCSRRTHALNIIRG